MGRTAIASHLRSLLHQPLSSHLAFISQETDLAEREKSRPGQRALWSCPLGRSQAQSFGPHVDQFLQLSCLQGTGGHSFGQRSPLWQGTASVCWVVPQLGAFSQYQQWTHFLLSCSFTSNYVHTTAIQSVFVYSFSARLILHWLCTPIIILST